MMRGSVLENKHAELKSDLTGGRATTVLARTESCGEIQRPFTTSPADTCRTLDARHLNRR